jgi:hypothetical protein
MKFSLRLGFFASGGNTAIAWSFRFLNGETADYFCLRKKGAPLGAGAATYTGKLGQQGLESA